MRIKGFGGLSGWRRREVGSWRSRRERASSLHLGCEVPHICRAGSVGWRSGCWYPLRVRGAGLWLLFRLLNNGLLQLLLRILLSTSLSSTSSLASTTQSPSTALLLRKISALLLLVLELGGVTCLFNRAELVCSLLVKTGRTCSSVGLPRCPHSLDDLI